MTGPALLRPPRCPRCSRVFGSLSNLQEPRNPGGAPMAGSVILCTHCGFLSLFTSSGAQLRAPSRDEYLELIADPAIAEVVDSWLREHR